MNKKLDNGYTIRIVEKDKFLELQGNYRDKVFQGDHSVFPYDFLPIDEVEKIKSLKANLYKDQFAVFLGVYDSSNSFVGWSYGYQENANVFYMCNSAILEEHRRQGLYTELMKANIELAKDKGFQIIYSRHNATNNAVIIPKLKAGFVISNLEMDDVFGVLVHLKYFTNETRRKIMDYRSGQLAPDQELKKLFKM